VATPSTTSQRHPIWARVYARISPTMDAQGAVEHRRTLLAGLAGRVLEVGAGNGLNLAHYPPAVTEVLAVEPEPYLRGLAEVAARQAPVRSGWSTAAPTLSRRRTPAWTLRSPPWCCARSQIRPVPWPSSTGYCDPEESYASSSTFERTPSAWPGSSDSPT
jgi:hypothetical protein